MSIKPKVRARYKVVGPQLVKRVKPISYMDKSGSLQYEDKEVEEKLWMVYFPQGHSIRVNEKELRRQRFHLKPRLVDMNTGDVLDLGGDEYDLSQDIEDRDIELVEDEEILNGPKNPASQKVAKVN